MVLIHARGALQEEWAIKNAQMRLLNALPTRAGKHKQARCAPVCNSALTARPFEECREDTTARPNQNANPADKPAAERNRHLPTYKGHWAKPAPCDNGGATRLPNARFAKHMPATKLRTTTANVVIKAIA